MSIFSPGMHFCVATCRAAVQYADAYMAILPKDLTRGPAVTSVLLSVWIQTVA